MKVLTKEECKKVLSRIGIKLGVSPNLIATRLLSDKDKLDMLEGKIEISSLKCFIEAWMKSGMPDYAHGKTISMKEELAMMNNSK